VQDAGLHDSCSSANIIDRLISIWVRALTVPMHLGAYILRSTNKEDKMGGTCSALGTDARRIKVMVGKHEKTNILQELGIDGTMVLKYM